MKRNIFPIALLMLVSAGTSTAFQSKPAKENNTYPYQQLPEVFPGTKPLSAEQDRSIRILDGAHLYRDLLVDGGRFAYRGDLAEKFRAYATGSESHNVLLIDGAGQDAGPRVTTEPLRENTYKITEEFDYAAGSFETFKGNQGAVQHTRAVFYMRSKFWIVLDRVETDRPRKVEALWHWHPDLTVVTQQDGVVSTNVKKGNLRIIPVGKTDWVISHVKGQEQPPQGWYSEKYNKAEPNVATVYATNIEGASSFVWILQPSSGTSLPLKAEILSQDKEKVRVRLRDEKLNQWEILVPFSNSDLADYTFKPALGVPEQGGEGAK